MRWIVRLLSAVLALVVIGLGLLYFVPSEKVAALAASQFQKMTGRALTFEGSVRPTLWPQLGVQAGGVSLANAAWSDEGPMLTAKSMSIALDMMSLIGGTVRITGIEVSEPVLVLEQAADGQVNWDLLAAGAEGEGGAAQPFTLDRMVIDAGTVRYLDHRAGSRVDLSNLDLDVAIPDFDGPVEGTGSATVHGQAVEIRGRIGAFAPFVDGKVVPVALTARAGGSEVVFDGRLGLAPMAAEGQIDAGLADMAAVWAVLGMEAPGLPEGLGARTVAIRGKVTLTPQATLHLRDGTLGLDGNTLQGAFDLVPGKARPKLTAQLVAGALNLESLGAGESGGGGGWSGAPIDAGGLGALDATVALVADSIDLGTAKLGKTRASLTNDAARAVFDVREAAAYGGAVSGQIVVNARNGLSARADLALKGLALEPLLTDLAGFDQLTGTGDIRFNLLGVGGSLDALMRSLEGEGSLTLRKGEYRGFDLAGMLRAFDPTLVGEGASTVFDSIAGTFTVAGGVLSNPDLAINALLVTAAGAGQVDIGGQTLDYRITPATLAGQALEPDMQVPVQITGPWAAPRFRLDVETIAKRKLEEEAAKLEERAKAEIAEKLQEELGVTPIDGESIEDTARRAAEEALQDEATRALERVLGGGSGD